MDKQYSLKYRQSLKRYLLGLVGRLPYGGISRLLTSFFGNKLLQRLLFEKHRRQLQRMYEIIGCSGDAVRDLTCHLMTRYTIPWRVNALSRSNDAVFRSWVRIENENVISDLKTTGKPILLVGCHTGITRLVPLVVTRMGHDDLAALEPEPYLILMGALGTERIQYISLRGEGEKFWMKEMFRAKKVLDAKGIVLLSLDGHQGTGGIPHAFLGRKRVFHVSLAQLAIQMDAAIVLVTATFDEFGRTTVRFRGPLDLGDSSMPVEARLGMFLNPYVAAIEAIWRNDLGNVSPRHFRPYLHSLPISAPQEKENAA